MMYKIIFYYLFLIANSPRPKKGVENLMCIEILIEL